MVGSGRLILSVMPDLGVNGEEARDFCEVHLVRISMAGSYGRAAAV